MFIINFCIKYYTLIHTYIYTTLTSATNIHYFETQQQQPAALVATKVYEFMMMHVKNIRMLHLKICIYVCFYIHYINKNIFLHINIIANHC